MQVLLDHTTGAAIAFMVALHANTHDPLGFVYFAFPWGEEGSELAGADGPEMWQRQLLTDLGEGLISVNQAIMLATTSGHGVGKSACVAWIVWWAMSTFEDTRGVVTANTENQLKTKTWVEVAVWYRRFIGRDFFKLTATAIFSVDPEHEKTWRIDMVPWSERNTEAFAGLHNQGKRILVLFDEGSAIPDLIWEVTEGALTDRNTQIIWAVFGNPTRNTGRFRDCFPGGNFSHRWMHRRVDSRTVSFTNHEQSARWIADYGEDSDFVRIRILGVFPRVDADSFISAELAREACGRTLVPIRGEAVVLGVDVGRFGDDPSVIYPRKGRDAVTLPPEIYPYIDTMELADKIADAYLNYHASFVFVDGGGVGGGVVDRLRQLRIPVIDVQFGAKADHAGDYTDGTKYANKRAELWGNMRLWLKDGAIPERINGVEITLVDELSGPSYGLNAREEILLEAKKDMRRRNVPSPNIADALACTFAASSYLPDNRQADRLQTVDSKAYKVADFNPFDVERMYS